MNSQVSSNNVVAEERAYDRRADFLSRLIGCKYEKNAKGPEKFDCWHLTVHIQRALFNRAVPLVEVPENANWHWMIEQFKSHSELENWVELLQPANGLVNASDGAVVLMARTKQPAHCGVYLQKEQGIIHADELDGVIFQDVATLKMNSWNRLRYYEPR
jgi:cell wall-associated NlpC family hydrolase